MAGAVPSDDDMRKIVAEADADLQYVLTEAAASLSTMYQICKIHKTRRRFQAIADSRAEARSAARTDFSIPNDTAEGRAQTASVGSWQRSIALKKQNSKPKPRCWVSVGSCRSMRNRPC